jgi:hypothetical protein
MVGIALKDNQSGRLGLLLQSSLFFFSVASCVAMTGCRTHQSKQGLLASSEQGREIQIDKASIQAWGRLYTASCSSYYTSTSADLDVTVRDHSIGWGSKVYLESGLTNVASSEGRTTSWDSPTSVEMKSVDQYTWKATRTAKMVERGHSNSHDSIGFVIRVVDQANQKRYIKPSSGNSYLRATFNMGQAQCQSPDGEPAMKMMKLASVID